MRVTDDSPEERMAGPGNIVGLLLWAGVALWQSGWTVLLALGALWALGFMLVLAIFQGRESN